MRDQDILTGAFRPHDGPDPMSLVMFEDHGKWYVQITSPYNLGSQSEPNWSATLIPIVERDLTLIEETTKATSNKGCKVTDFSMTSGNPLRGTMVVGRIRATTGGADFDVPGGASFVEVDWFQRQTSIVKLEVVMNDSVDPAAFDEAILPVPGFARANFREAERLQTPETVLGPINS